MRTLAEPPKRPVGLVLSGGGARAAYQVGVLRAIADLLPARASCPFDVVAGTSAGALNGVSLAAHARHLRSGVKALESIWLNLESGQVYDTKSARLLSNASSILFTSLRSGAGDSPVALLDNAPLADLLTRTIRFDRIQRNIDAGLIDAVSVTASAYSTGESVSFYQAVKSVEDWSGPHRIGRRARLRLDHLMASTAIPIIFPAVNIGNQCFGDGAMRQLAPTSTARRLGARRILAIGVSANRTMEPLEDEMTGQPSLWQIMGHILNSAFVDALENDLGFLRQINKVVSHVPNRARARLGLDEIDLLEISPSRQLDRIALEYADELPGSLARHVSARAGTLLSLVLYEKGFCNALWRLGFDDAMEKEEEIRRFFAGDGQEGR